MKVTKGAHHTFNPPSEDRFVSSSVRIRRTLHEKMGKMASASGMSLNAFLNDLLVAGVERIEAELARISGPEIAKVPELVQAGQEINHPDLGPGITPSLRDGTV